MQTNWCWSHIFPWWEVQPKWNAVSLVFPTHSLDEPWDWTSQPLDECWNWKFYTGTPCAFYFSTLLYLNGEQMFHNDSKVLVLILWSLENLWLTNKSKPELPVDRQWPELVSWPRSSCYWALLTRRSHNTQLSHIAGSIGFHCTHKRLFFLLFTESDTLGRFSNRVAMSICLSLCLH